MAFGSGEPPIPRPNGVVVVVSPIDPDASIVVVLVTELGGVVDGETTMVVVVVVVAERGGVVEGETPVVVVVVVTELGGVVEGETSVVVVTVVVVEVVVVLGITLKAAVAQISDPRRQAVIW